jgi:hypothetical protein
MNKENIDFKDIMNIKSPLEDDCKKIEVEFNKITKRIEEILKIVGDTKLSDITAQVERGDNMGPELLKEMLILHCNYFPLIDLCNKAFPILRKAEFVMQMYANQVPINDVLKKKRKSKNG